MTTAFVLGGGGVLGAVEVGMLRALFERDVIPDLVLGTSVGALNGAMVARDPSLAVIERLTELWQAAGASREVYGDRPLRTVRRAVSTGHPHLLRQAAATAAGRGVRRPALRGPAGALPGVRGQHRARRRALVRLRPAGAGDRRQRRRARAAAPGPRSATSTSSTAASSTRSRSGGPSSSAPTSVFVLQVGRIDRPLTVPRAAVGGGAGDLRGRPPAPLRPRAGRAAPDVVAHVLPARRHVGHGRLDARPPRASRACANASRRRTAPASPTSTSSRATRRLMHRVRRLIWRPSSVLARPVLIGVTLPLWLIGAAALSPVIPGRWRALRLLWVAILYLDVRVAAAGVLLGLWLASGFGWRIRSPYFAGIHYDLVQGVLVGLLPRGAAGAGPADRHRRAGARRAPGHGRSWSAAATRGRATRSC